MSSLHPLNAVNKTAKLTARMRVEVSFASFNIYSFPPPTFVRWVVTMVSQFITTIGIASPYEAPILYLLYPLHPLNAPFATDINVGTS